jgi:hypothetical protein
MTHFTTTFDPTNPAHRLVSGWSRDGKFSWQHTARAYAQVTGEAKALRADGSVMRFFREDGIVRQRTYRQVLIAYVPPTRGAERAPGRP